MTEKVDKSCYSGEPLRSTEGIPVFSRRTAYTRNYERISKEHLKALEETGQNPWIAEELWAQMEASTAALVEEYATPGCRILDVGVGLGRLLEKFPELDRYGLDVSHSYLQIAKSKGINVCYASVEDMPYEKEYFDVIVCTDVLEHVLDLNYAVTQILSVLKDDGVLVVRVPYRESMAGYTSPDCRFEYCHVRDFNEHTLELLFTKMFPCKIEATQLCGYYNFGEEKLRAPFGQYLKCDQWLDKLKNIAPDLFWQFLRWFGIPSEICAVIRKPKGLALKPRERLGEAPGAVGVASDNIVRLRELYNTFKQKHAFLTVYSQQRANLSTTSNEYLIAESGRLKETSEQLTASNTDLNAEIARLTELNQQLAASNEALNQQASEREQTNQQLTSSNEELNAETARLKDVNQQLSSANDELEAQAAPLRQQVEQLTRDIQQAKASTERLVGDNKRLGAELAELRQANEQLAAEVDKLETARQEWTADNKKLDTAKAQLKQTNEQLTTSNDQLNADVEKLRGRCSLLTDTNEELAALRQELNSQIELLKKRICIDPRALWRLIRGDSSAEKEASKHD